LSTPVSQVRSALAPANAAAQHGLEDVVHHVLGQRRVLQLALRKAHQVGAVGQQFAPVEAEGRGGGGLHGGYGCSGYGTTVAGAARIQLAEDHSQITLA
jgi:hypothetical protein